MAIKGTINLTGHFQLIRRLENLKKAARTRILKPSLEEGASITEAETKASAPVLTGQTRDAVKVVASKTRKGVVAVNVQVGEGDYKGDQFYASFIEYGTEKMDPQPFMRPAFDKTKGQAKRAIIAGIRARMTKAINRKYGGIARKLGKVRND